MKTCPNCNHQFTPGIMEYEVDELDETKGTIEIVIICPICYATVEFLYINIDKFIPIR